MDPMRDQPPMLSRRSTRLTCDTSQASNAQLAICDDVERLPLVLAGVSSHNPRLRLDMSGVKSRHMYVNRLPLLAEQVLSTNHPRRSASAVAAWKKHVADLTPLERQMFDEHRKDSLAQYTAHIEKLCREQGEASKGMKIAKFVRPWYRVMSQYAPVAETIMQADPTSSTILLGGITCILSISERYSSFPERIMETLAAMGEKLDLLTQYGEDVYQDNDSVQGAIVEVFADVLQFNKRALRLLLHDNGRRKSTTRMFFKSFTSSFQGHFGDIVSKFENDLVIFEERAKLCSRTEEHQFRSNNTGAQVYILSEIMQTRADIHQYHASAIQGQHVAMLEASRHKQEDEAENRLLREEIIKWLNLAAIDFYTDQNNLIFARTEETGTWLLNDAKYLAWKQGLGSQLLWVKAERGCGKTHLASIVVQDLKAMCDGASNLRSNAKEISAFAFIYCTSLDAAKVDLTRLLSSLVLQLSSQLPGAVVDPLLRALYNRHHATRAISFDEVSKVLESLVCMFGQAYLVVDGLDELRDSPNEQLEKKCRYLRHLAQFQGDKSVVKVIAFSRPEYPAISNAFDGCPNLRIDDGANNQDIEKFIGKKWEVIESHFPKDPDISRDLLQLKQELVRKSEGMFLWAEHTLRALRGQYTIKGLRQKIEESPNDLNVIYQQALVKIAGNEQAPSTALKILLWVCNAKRPLLRAELMDALSIHPGMTTLARDDRIYRDDEFCSKCEDLIVLDHTHQTYQLRHSSLKDYLTKTTKDPLSAPAEYRELQEAANYILGEACLTYLNFTDFGTGPVSTMESLKQLIVTHPLLRYAAVYWGTHVAAIEDDHLRNLTRTFVTTSERRNLAMQLFTYLDADTARLSTGSSAPAHILAIFDLAEIAFSLPDLAKQVAEEDGLRYTPMDYALERRSRRVCSQLLMAVEDLRVVQEKSRYSLLHMAARNGWSDIVKKLLDLGYDVATTAGDEMTTALHAAAYEGSLEVLRTLLDNGADKDAREMDGSTPLWTACVENNSDFAKGLIAADSNVALSSLDGFTPLHFAALNGDFELANLLLQKGADKDAACSESGHGRTPLHCAAEQGRLNVLQLLLNTGAKKDVTGSDRLSALHLASHKGNLKCVDALLGAGARLSVQDNGSSSIVHLATEGGHLDVLKLLFHRREPECTAMVNNWDSDGATPLRLAAANGHHEITNFLLGKGALPKKTSPLRRYPIHAAIANAQIDIVRLYMHLDESCARWQDNQGVPAIHWVAFFSIEHPALNDLIGPLLNAGSDPEVPGVTGWRAIHTALERGNVRFMEILYDKFPGLQLNACTARQQSALHIAADNGMIESVKWLVATQGTLEQTQDSDGNTPLQCAAWGGFLDVLKLVLTRQHVNLRGFEGRTALFGACARGHSDCVQFLLDNGADPNIPDKFGDTPLIASIRTDHTKIANLLLDRVANPFIESKKKRSALHIACVYGNEVLVCRLLDLNPDPLHRDLHGSTAFHFALSSPNPKVIDAFIKHGLDRWDESDLLGRTCLHWLAAFGDVRRLKRFKKFNIQHLGAVDGIGRNSLWYAATGGHVEMCEELLALGLHVQGADSTPRGVLHGAAAEGYVEVVRKLIRTPHGIATLNEMNGPERKTPLHNAVASNHSGIAGILVQAGANLLTRDSRGLLALDYTSHYPQLWTETGILKPNFAYTKLTSRLMRLKETAHEAALKLIGQPDNLTPTDEYYRSSGMLLLATILHEISTEESRERAMICFLECVNPPEDSAHPFNWDCNICRRVNPPGPLYICEQSLVEVFLCHLCHKDYETGNQSQRQTPKSVRMLESLQQRIRPIRQALAPFVTEFGAEFIVDSCALLVSNDEALTKLEQEGMEWTRSYNERLRFDYEQIVDLRFLEWMQKAKKEQDQVPPNTQRTAASEQPTEEGSGNIHSTLYTPQEDQVTDDDDRYNALNQELLTLFREGRVEKELRTFNCNGHKFAQIIRMEDASQQEKSCFGKDGRVMRTWLRDLATWLSQLVVDTDATENAKDEQASSPIGADKANADQDEGELRETAKNICGDSESTAVASNGKLEPKESVNAPDHSTGEAMGPENEQDDDRRNQEISGLNKPTKPVNTTKDAEFAQLAVLQKALLENMAKLIIPAEEEETFNSNKPATYTEELRDAVEDQILKLNAVQSADSSLDAESSAVDDHHNGQLEENDEQLNTDRPSKTSVSEASSDNNGSERTLDRNDVIWLMHEVAWRVAQARLLGAITQPTLRQQRAEALAESRNANETRKASEEASSAAAGAEIQHTQELEGSSDKLGATGPRKDKEQAQQMADQLNDEKGSRTLREPGQVKRDASSPESAQRNPASPSTMLAVVSTDGLETEMRMDMDEGAIA